MIIIHAHFQLTAEFILFYLCLRESKQSADLCYESSVLIIIHAHYQLTTNVLTLQWKISVWATSKQSADFLLSLLSLNKIVIILQWYWYLITYFCKSFKKLCYTCILIIYTHPEQNCINHNKQLTFVISGNKIFISLVKLHNFYNVPQSTTHRADFHIFPASVAKVWLNS